MDIIIAVLNEIVMLVIVRVAKAEYEMKFASENVHSYMLHLMPNSL